MQVKIFEFGRYRVCSKDVKNNDKGLHCDIFFFFYIKRILAKKQQKYVKKNPGCHQTL